MIQGRYASAHVFSRIVYHKYSLRKIIQPIECMWNIKQADNKECNSYSIYRGHPQSRTSFSLDYVSMHVNEWFKSAKYIEMYRK